MAAAPRPVLDRVSERRRAAALARHYRDVERLSIAEIARRLGRAPATVKAYLYDPYSAWFNAQQRSSSALRAWSEARPAGRAGAYRTYLVELVAEEMAAADLERLHRQRLAA